MCSSGEDSSPAAMALVSVQLVRLGPWRLSTGSVQCTVTVQYSTGSVAAAEGACAVPLNILNVS